MMMTSKDMKALSEGARVAEDVALGRPEIRVLHVFEAPGRILREAGFAEFCLISRDNDRIPIGVGERLGDARPQAWIVRQMPFERAALHDDARPPIRAASPRLIAPLQQMRE